MEEPVTKQTTCMDENEQDRNEDQEIKVQYIPTYVQSYKQMNNIRKRQEAHKSFSKKIHITIPQECLV